MKTLLLGDVQRSDVKEILDLIVDRYACHVISMVEIKGTFHNNKSSAYS